MTGRRFFFYRGNISITSFFLSFFLVGKYSRNQSWLLSWLLSDDEKNEFLSNMVSDFLESVYGDITDMTSRESGKFVRDLCICLSFFFLEFFFWMHLRVSIRRCVRRSVCSPFFFCFLFLVEL